MAITPASLEKLKSGAISKVIESLGSKLKRVGREYVTQCVWHEDTNPSLTINDDKDGDGGANDKQNYGLVGGVVHAGGNTLVHGSLNSTPDQEFRIEVWVDHVEQCGTKTNKCEECQHFIQKKHWAEH